MRGRPNLIPAAFLAAKAPAPAVCLPASAGLLADLFGIQTGDRQGRSPGPRGPLRGLDGGHGVRRLDDGASSCTSGRTTPAARVREHLACRLTIINCRGYRNGPN